MKIRFCSLLSFFGVILAVATLLACGDRVWRR